MFGTGGLKQPGGGGVHHAVLQQVGGHGPGSGGIQAVTHPVDDMHDHIGFRKPHAGDADVSAASPTALYKIPLLRREPGGEHIVDLAGYAAQVIGQLVALDLRGAVGLVEQV